MGLTGLMIPYCINDITLAIHTSWAFPLFNYINTHEFNMPNNNLWEIFEG